MSKTLPPAMILCGGQGTRLRDVAESVPKPMVPIGPHPIIWHIMKSYAAFGVRRFILCLGYKREAFIDYFLTYRAKTCDITVRTGSNGGVVYHGETHADDWEVVLADTGERTMTGGRVAIAAKHLAPGDESFFLTYGDGVANVDLAALWRHHCGHDLALTVTAVHPAGRFGEISCDGDVVRGFHEKPQTESGLINGGFMAVRRRFIEKYLSNDRGTILEQQPMRRAAADGQMSAFKHQGFWQCMDTPREHQLLNDLWDRGEAPWAENW